MLLVTMVHPSELLRTNSNEARTFSAPRNEYQLDCGLTNLPFLNRCFNLETLAKPKVFLVFLSIVGFLQGITVTYFRETATLWGKHYNIAQENIDWLIYTNEFFNGIFALFVAYYGNRIHRISWIGGLTIFQAVSSGVLVIPEIYRKNYKEQANLTENYLCPAHSVATTDDEINYIALTVLGIYQIFFALASISFISHGMSYLDDNTSLKNSPGYIGIALACRELGKQAGLYFSWIPSYFKMNTIFVSPVWLSIASIAFIVGTLIAMFPRSMPSTLVRTLSASLVDLASGYTAPRQKQRVDGLFKTLFRLLKNEILMVNIFCSVLLQSGLINFNIFEKFFNQSRFQVSHLNDTSYTQFTTNILKQPLVAICLIATGFVIAKTRPHLKSLVKWNIVAIILVVAFFASTAFLKCEPNTTYERMLEKTSCNTDCKCMVGDFQPVCVGSQTYYSPCFAGCREVKDENSRKTYFNCTCSQNAKDKAAAGPCDEQKCTLFYAISQINRIFTTALLASTLVTNLIINMRCIVSTDKATALGLEATFTALIPYLPVKAIYDAVADHYCVYPKNSKGLCRLFSKHFATFLSLCTIGFMVGSLILAVVVLILLKFRPVKEKNEDDDDSENVSVELQPMRTTVEENGLMSEQSQPRDVVDSGQNHKRAGLTDSISGSLLEMENVGDDHDSIGSSSYLDDTRNRLNRSRIIESDL